MARRYYITEDGRKIYLKPGERAVWTVYEEEDTPQIGPNGGRNLTYAAGNHVNPPPTEQEYINRIANELKTGKITEMDIFNNPRKYRQSAQDLANERGKERARKILDERNNYQNKETLKTQKFYEDYDTRYGAEYEAKLQRDIAENLRIENYEKMEEKRKHDTVVDINKSHVQNRAFLDYLRDLPSVVSGDGIYAKELRLSPNEREERQRQTNRLIDEHIKEKGSIGKQLLKEFTDVDAYAKSRTGNVGKLEDVFNAGYNIGNFIYNNLYNNVSREGISIPNPQPNESKGRDYYINKMKEEKARKK